MMRLSILVDNMTLIDRYFLGEPGFSAFIDEDGRRVLFDLGYSGIFLDNARRMNIDLSSLDYVCLSHGHLDHSWGLERLIRFYTEEAFEGRPVVQPSFVAHSDTLKSIIGGDAAEIGPLLSEEKLAKHFSLSLKKWPQRLSDRLVFLGGIPRVTDFEGRTAFGRKEGENSDDLVPDDSALVYSSAQGLVIVTGCAHSGICNIIEYAKEVCGEERIADIIGGFHLLHPTVQQLEGTAEYFARQKIERIHPCHCTGLEAKIALSRVVKVEEAGVGLSLEYS